MQLVCSALQRDQGLFFQRAERLGLLDLGLNALSHLFRIFVITNIVKGRSKLRGLP